MALVDPNSITNGQTIRFKSISTHDNVILTGKVVGIVNYDIARAIEDVDTYYLDVKKYNPDLTAKEALTYLVLHVAENDTTTVTRVFATAWIDAGSLEIIEENTYVTIKVYDVSEDRAKDILAAIQDLGYVAEVVS